MNSTHSETQISLRLQTEVKLTPTFTKDPRRTVTDTDPHVTKVFTDTFLKFYSGSVNHWFGSS